MATEVFDLQTQLRNQFTEGLDQSIPHLIAVGDRCE